VCDRALPEHSPRAAVGRDRVTDPPHYEVQ
jgi:hypothetical protein